MAFDSLPSTSLSYFPPQCEVYCILSYSDILEGSGDDIGDWGKDPDIL